MHKFVAIVFFLNIFFVQNFIAQNRLPETYVSIKLSNASVNKALDILSKKTGCYFSYDARIVNSEKKITLNERQKPLKNILEKIFSEQLSFTVIKNHIIISKQEKNSFSDLIISDSTIQIKGEIIDAETKKPIAFASVGILNTMFGTVSNQNGEFLFRFPASCKDSTVYIANIAYKNKEVPVLNFTNKLNIIKLRQAFISIEEVIIRNADPKQILKNAILNSKKNYFQNPVIISAFYRESIQKNKHLSGYSEALLKIYKTPYRPTLRSDRIKVEKSRKIVSAEKNDTLKLKLQDGLYSSLNLDFIKNPINFLDENNMQYYDYRLIDIVPYNNSTAYLISFEQKKSVKNPLYKGKIYVDNKNFAVIAAEFQYNMKSNRNKLNFVVKKTGKIIVKPVSARYFIKYKKINGKYILNHVRAELSFKVRKKRSIFASDYYASFETAAFDYQTKNVSRFNRKNSLKRNQIFIDNRYEYDRSFWGQNNFISPEKSVTEALKEIRTKIKSSQ